MDKEKWKNVIIAFARGISLYCTIFTIDFYIQSFHDKTFVPYWGNGYVIPYIVVHAWFLRPKAIKTKKEQTNMMSLGRDAIQAEEEDENK